MTGLVIDSDSVAVVAVVAVVVAGGIAPIGLGILLRGCSWGRDRLAPRVGVDSLGLLGEERLEGFAVRAVDAT